MRAFLDLLFPKRCVGCGGKPAPLPFCQDCMAALEALPLWRCPTCAGTLPPPLERQGVASPCAGCVAAPPPFVEVLAPFVYGGPAATAIHRLKYLGSREVAGRLAPFLYGAGRAPLEEADLVAPIPLYARRRRKRGFDQAVLLARAAADLAGRPLSPRLLVRRRGGRHQVGQGRDERGANMEGAFAANGPVEGASILLIDDVVTTGATAGAAASALLEAGAAEVRVLAVARAL